MSSDEVILRTKLNPPKPPRTTLTRPRVEALLRQAFDYRVTVMQASTGYGKSTALANLADASTPLFWYSATEGDADPRQFLAHLSAAFQSALSNSPLTFLQDDIADSLQSATHALLNALNDVIRAPSLVVIDDYHLAASPDVNALLDHFLAFIPADLHAIVATRYPPTWEHLVTWRARDQVLDIKREALAFTRTEIAALFRDKYHHDLAPRDVALLEQKTEGWPIALPLVWQEIRANSQTNLATLLARDVADHEDRPYLETLFAYLARDVLAQQSREVQQFLLQTCVLRELDADACSAVSDGADVQARLAQLQERDLFIVSVGEKHFRYHHLFHDFLREQAARENPNAVRERHQRAAEFYTCPETESKGRAAQNFDEAVYHWMQAREFERAAQLLEEMGEMILRGGRLDTLATWLDEIPPETVAAHPLLIFYLGDLARLRSRFDEALAWYAQAERAWRSSNDIGGISRALRGQALVYLDTVRPARAEDLLQEALRLSDGLDDRAARARLLELLAENKLNMGKAEEAERLRLQARTLREEGPSEDVLSVRVKLRTGRLNEAREILETWARDERGKPHAPRAHRETLLLLSLVHAMQGNADAALAAAQEGIALATDLNSPFVSAVGQMRLGHAHQIRGELAQALRCYENAVALGDQIAVPRTRAEARWGMTRAHGLLGDLAAARRDAVEGIEIASGAGDVWVVALVQIALGSSQVLARREREGIESLNDALAAMRSCGDTFGGTAARLWLALARWRLNQRERALAHLSDVLDAMQSYRHDYLLTARTLLGLPDPRAIVPLLLEMRQRGKHATYITQLLATLGLEKIIGHPGYQLRVQTLGAFRVWRGDEEVGAREWTRKKARQLFQLFITRRGRMIEREEIFELLYRDASTEAASRDFKVALNALNKVLEPERGDEEPAFIARKDSAYGLRADADLWLDADEFARLVTDVDKSGGNDALGLYRRALALYQDDYLITEARYEDWAVAERERLLALYLRAVDRLANGVIAQGAYDETIVWCEKILARDPCWEPAYRMMMQAYAARGDRAQARRVYEQCVRIFREELDVEPSAATRQVYEQIVTAV